MGSIGDEADVDARPRGPVGFFQLWMSYTPAMGSIGDEADVDARPRGPVGFFQLWMSYTLTPTAMGSIGDEADVDARPRGPVGFFQLWMSYTPQRVPVAMLALPSEAPRRVALEGSSNSPFCCEVGEQVEVLYDAEDVDGTATVDRATELYGVQLLVAAVAAVFLLPLGFALRGGGRA
jgi:hypothetical protein